MLWAARQPQRGERRGVKTARPRRSRRLAGGAARPSRHSVPLRVLGRRPARPRVPRCSRRASSHPREWRRRFRNSRTRRRGDAPSPPPPPPRTPPRVPRPGRLPARLDPGQDRERRHQLDPRQGDGHEILEAKGRKAKVMDLPRELRGLADLGEGRGQEQRADRDTAAPHQPVFPEEESRARHRPLPRSTG